MRKKIPKCPKCGKEPVIYDEYWSDAYIQFEVGTFKNVGHEIAGNPYCVYAQCDCGYYWRLRNVTQIWDIKRLYMNDVTAEAEE
jgi:hypothetical protein